MSLSRPSGIEYIDESTAILYASAWLQRLTEQPNLLEGPPQDPDGVIETIHQAERTVQDGFLEHVNAMHRWQNLPQEVLEFLWGKYPDWKDLFKEIQEREKTDEVEGPAPAPRPEPEPRPAPAPAPEPTPAPRPAPAPEPNPNPNPNPNPKPQRPDSWRTPLGEYIRPFAHAAVDASVINAVAGLHREEKPKPQASTEPPPPEKIPEGYTYNEIGQIFRKLSYESHFSTAEIASRAEALFMEVYTAPEGVFFYYDGLYNLVGKETLPDELKKFQGPRAQYEPRLQEWHNANRKRLMPDGPTFCPNDFNTTGYPFVASAALGANSTSDEDEKDTDPSDVPNTLDVAMGNLETECQNPLYFNGEKKRLFDFVVAMADAYDLPRALVLGVGGVESHFDPNQISHNKAGQPIAYGLYQIIPGTFEAAATWADAHPDIHQKFRQGALPDFRSGWGDPFVSAEVGCAYLHLLKESLAAPVGKLEERLLQLNPSFRQGTFQEIAVINSYNAGPGIVIGNIKRFLALSDEEIKAKIGEPAYGLDVWLAVMGNSYGLTINGKDQSMKFHVYTYPYRITALGSALSEADSYLTQYGVDKTPGLNQLSKFFDTDVPTAERGSTMVGATRTAATTFGTATAVSAAIEAIPSQPVSRRGFLGLLGAAGATAAAVPLVQKFRGPVEVVEVKESPADLKPLKLPADSEVYEESRQALDRLYSLLKSKGVKGELKLEIDAAKFHDAPKQRKMLAKYFIDMLGKDLFDKIVTSTNQNQKDRADLYKDAQKKQAEYFKKIKKTGDYVAIPANDPEFAYFAEQIGNTKGIENDPEMMFMHKEYAWILPTIIELINYQVDLFNQDSTAFGYSNGALTLDRITAGKISGAARTILQSDNMLTNGQAARTTKEPTPHWLGGLAIDWMANATQHSHMVRLEDGELLSVDTKGNDMAKRDLYSLMARRALLSIVDAAARKNVYVGFRWEGSQHNCHIFIVPEIN